MTITTLLRALVPVFLTASPAQAASPAVSSPGCMVKWDAVRTLHTRDGRPIFVDVRSATEWRGHVVFAGDPSYSWASPTAAAFLPGETPRNQLFAAAILGNGGLVSTVKMPPGIPMLMQPRVAGSADQVLHLAFGMKTGPAQRAIDFRPDSVMSAEWNGRDWARLKRVPIGGDVLWSPISVSDLRTTGSGIAFVAPLSSRDSMTAGFVANDRRGVWHARLLATGGVAAAYMRLDRMGRSLIMTWIGAEAVRGVDDRNALFVARSTDGGATWSARSRLEPVGSSAAYDPVLVHSRTAVYLIWAKRSQPTGLPDSIGAAVSRDEGQTWRILPSLHVPEGFTTLSARFDRGRVITVFRDATEDRVRIRALIADRWLVPTGDAGPVSSGTPLVIGEGQHGRLGVLFPKLIPTRVATGDGHGQALATSLQTFQLNCEER